MKGKTVTYCFQSKEIVDTPPSEITDSHYLYTPFCKKPIKEVPDTSDGFKQIPYTTLSKIIREFIPEEEMDEQITKLFREAHDRGFANRLFASKRKRVEVRVEVAPFPFDDGTPAFDPYICFVKE